MAAVTEAIHLKSIMGDHVQQTVLPRVTSSQATFRIPVLVAPFDCVLTEVALINSTIVTGANTNTVHLNLINGGAEGAGTTQIANRDLVLATDVPVGKTVLHAGDTDLTQGDMVELEYEEIGTGLGADIPEMIAYITYRGR